MNTHASSEIIASRATQTAAVIETLREKFAERLSTSASVREQHGREESYHESVPPQAVVYARSTEEVATVVRECSANGVAVVPYGTGTSLEGHVAALHGGICIDVSQMDQILAVNAEDLDVVIQPGVTRRQLNDYLRDMGLFFPVDPGANASLGGMAATRASGTNAVRYGTMRDAVLALTVVLADGRIVKTARRARKSAAGYDLTRLFVGSEGTLGVITELTLRVHGIPEAISSAVCPFETLAGAVNTVIATIQSGIPVARIELLDEIQIEAVNSYSKLELPVSPTLFLEFHGSEASVREQAEAMAELAADEGGEDFQWTTNTEERNRLWRARHDVAYAARSMCPGKQLWATDVCVPISRLAECVLETRRDIDDSGLYAPIVGHVGDGNFHVAFVIDPHDTDEVARANQVNERMVRRALDMDGTCTGEHGIGCGKLDFLEAELGEAVDVMRAVKHALDPHNLMNPGKVLRFD